MRAVLDLLRRKTAIALGAALLASGCAMSDEKMARFLVAPDKFVLYTCPEMVEKAQALTERERELEGLMAKAGQSADGRLVSSMAYRPDYISTRGEIAELQKAAAAKNCNLSGPVGADGRTSAVIPR